jgi:hypothetical protein
MFIITILDILQYIYCTYYLLKGLPRNQKEKPEKMDVWLKITTGWIQYSIPPDYSHNVWELLERISI